MPTAGTKLSDEQIAKAAYNAGFRGPELITAIAVAKAESQGYSHATNSYSEGGKQYQVAGLWQISDIHKSNSKLAEFFANIFDPQTNAKAAYEISGGGSNWLPWSVYKSGAYKEHLDSAKVAAFRLGEPDREGRFSDVISFSAADAVSALGSGAAEVVADAAGTVAGGVGDALGSFFTSGFFKRILLGLLGLICFGVAVTIIARGM